MRRLNEVPPDAPPGPPPEVPGDADPDPGFIPDLPLPEIGPPAAVSYALYPPKL